VVIKARGDAESIKIRGEALKLTPAFIDLQIVEKWDGRAPLYVGGASSGGVNMLLPAVDLQKSRAAAAP
jgi:prohibitin 2